MPVFREWNYPGYREQLGWLRSIAIRFDPIIRVMMMKMIYDKTPFQLNEFYKSLKLAIGAKDNDEDPCYGCKDERLRPYPASSGFIHHGNCKVDPRDLRADGTRR